MTPLVSVLVPAYQSAPYIEACLESVLAQSFGDFELVLVDDASTDGTFEAARRLLGGDRRARLLRNAANLGAREAFRRCLASSSAPWVKFVCSDDLLEPDALEAMLEAARSEPAAVLVTSPRLRVDASGQLLEVLRPPCQGTLEGRVAGDLMLARTWNWVGEPTTALFARSSLPLEGLWRLGSAEPSRNLDLLWWLKILATGRLVVLPDPLSSFRSHPRQTSARPGIRAELVLSWREILRGAAEVGYLRSPALRLSALRSFQAMVRAELPDFDPASAALAEAALAEAGLEAREVAAR